MRNGCKTGVKRCKTGEKSMKRAYKPGYTRRDTHQGVYRVPTMVYIGVHPSLPGTPLHPPSMPQYCLPDVQKRVTGARAGCCRTSSY